MYALSRLEQRAAEEAFGCRSCFSSNRSRDGTSRLSAPIDSLAEATPAGGAERHKYTDFGERSVQALWPTPCRQGARSLGPSARAHEARCG